MGPLCKAIGSSSSSTGAALVWAGSAMRGQTPQPIVNDGPAHTISQTPNLRERTPGHTGTQTPKQIPSQIRAAQSGRLWHVFGLLGEGSWGRIGGDGRWGRHRVAPSRCVRRVTSCRRVVVSSRRRHRRSFRRLAPPHRLDSFVVVIAHNKSQNQENEIEQ